MTIYYKHSKTASLFCILGCIIGICGIIAFIDTQSFEYFFVAAAGFLLLYMGSDIGSKAEFRFWMNAQTDKHLDERIRKSITFAMEKYQECPNKYTCNYIKNLNPEAGAYIQKDRKENRKNRVMQNKK